MNLGWNRAALFLLALGASGCWVNETGFACNETTTCGGGFICDSTGHCAAGTSSSMDAESPPTDSGPVDAGKVIDAGSDAGTADAGPTDSGPIDAGIPDAGSHDAGLVGIIDAGTTDAGIPDSGTPDAGHDAGPVDAGPVDAGPVDAGPVDAGVLDAGPLDAGFDAGTVDAGCLSNTSCTSTPTTPACNTVSGQCVACVANADCTGGSVCAGNNCTTACTGSSGCPTGESCVENECIASLPDGGPCMPNGCSTITDCQDNCGVPSSACSLSCSSTLGTDSCGQTNPVCGASGLGFAHLTGCPFEGYDAPVKIDSQTFELAIDTGTTTTVVAGTGCSTCAVIPEYKTDGGGMAADASVSEMLGSGTLTGEEYSDTVQVGTSIPAVTLNFGVITSVSSGILPSVSCSGSGSQQGEGLLGLGPPDLSVIGTANNDIFFSDLLATTGGAAVFGMNLCTSGGDIWFGGFDPSFATGPAVFTPMVPIDSTQPYYQVSISSIGIGGTTLAASAAPNAIVDTRFSAFCIPAFTDFIAELNQNATASALGLTANFFKQHKCSTATAQQVANLPPLTVTLPNTAGGTFTLTMPAAESYFVPTPGGYCSALLDSATCGAVAWGAPSLRAYLTIFDVGDQRIGFAPQNTCE